MSHSGDAEDGSLATTRWSLVGRARDEDSQGNRPALDELLRRYLPAMRVHLKIRRAGTNEEIEDLLQGFIASKILESKLVATATQSRGTFRTLLLTSLDRYAIDQRRHASAQKRDRAREVSLVKGMQNVADDGADRMVSLEFDIAWVRQILRQSVDRLRTECEAQHRVDLWKLFDGRILRPTLNDAEPVPYEELVAELGFKSPTQAWNALVTVKRMFERTLRSVIREYTHDDKLAEQELKDLCDELCGRAR
jgi:DNA-directed RNA polymerase specialized sigma24 family protein